MRRIFGQLSLADGLVSGRSGALDRIAVFVDWGGAGKADGKRPGGTGGAPRPQRAKDATFKTAFPNLQDRKPGFRKAFQTDVNIWQPG